MPNAVAVLLEPCPWCGEPGDQEYEDLGSGPPPAAAITCGACGARGPTGYGRERKDYPGALNDAAKEWNRRDIWSKNPMTTVTVELPFALTREHVLLLRAAERKFTLPVKIRAIGDLEQAGAIELWRRYPGDLFAKLMPLGRAILDQCPSLWDEAELEAKLREMAG